MSLYCVCFFVSFKKNVIFDKIFDEEKKKTRNIRDTAQTGETLPFGEFFFIFY